MIGRLTDSWKYSRAEIWEPLSKVSNAPIDLYIELYQTAMPYFKKQLDYKEDYSKFQTEMAGIWNDPELARKAFLQIKGDEFKGESELISFFEEAYDVIVDFDNVALTARYTKLTEVFLANHNLRYRIDKSFQFLVQLPWVYADLYKQLNTMNQRDAHLEELMNDFEDAFDAFVRTKRRRNLSTAIAKASNYAEGVASARLKLTKGGSLGEMSDQLAALRVWPHAGVQKTLTELYSFCNDYPGIRHGGTKSSKKRNLEAKDTIIISALLIAFSGYIQNQIKVDDILG